MNINIYNSTSFILPAQTNFNERHTVSSLNKIKNKQTKPVQSASDFVSSSCIQLLQSTCSNRKSLQTKPNIDMYKIGQAFMKQKLEKQKSLEKVLFEKFQQQCPFSPSISSNSKLLASKSNSRIIKPKDQSQLIDSQSQKLLKELEHCTFSPNILRNNRDIFDRMTSPFYERQLNWKQQQKIKLHETQSQTDIQLNLTLTKKTAIKQEDLRASHALKKNIAAKYLRKALTEQ